MNERHQHLLVTLEHELSALTFNRAARRKCRHLALKAKRAGLMTAEILEYFPRTRAAMERNASPRKLPPALTPRLRALARRLRAMGTRKPLPVGAR